MPEVPSIDAGVVAAFLAFLYGVQQGFACLSTSRAGQWREQFFEWPNQREELIERANSAAPHADVYVGVLLYCERRRAADTSLPGRIVWVDCDNDPDDVHRTWMEEHHGVIVNSGGDHRFHGYLLLAQATPAAELEQLSRALAAKIGGDSKWSASSVLRVPGTLHHKQYPPRLVTWSSPK